MRASWTATPTCPTSENIRIQQTGGHDSFLVHGIWFYYTYAVTTCLVSDPLSRTARGLHSQWVWDVSRKTSLCSSARPHITHQLTAAAFSPSTSIWYSYRCHDSLLFCHEHTITYGVDTCLGSLLFLVGRRRWALGYYRKTDGAPPFLSPSQDGVLEHLKIDPCVICVWPLPLHLLFLLKTDDLYFSLPSRSISRDWDAQNIQETPATSQVFMELRRADNIAVRRGNRNLPSFTLSSSSYQEQSFCWLGLITPPCFYTSLVLVQIWMALYIGEK